MFALRIQILILLIVFTSVSPAMAEADNSPGMGKIVTVPSGTVIDKDFFALGEIVEISGKVNGDVYAAGKHVRVTGTITGDLLAVAEILSISGTVSQDARIAGQQITVTGHIGKNVTAGAENLEFTNSATVKGSILAGAVDVIISSSVGRDVRVGATSLTITGKVNGNVSAFAENTVLTTGSSVQGDLTYWSEKEASIDEMATVEGKIKRILPSPPHTEEDKEKPRFLSGSYLLIKALSFLTLLVIGILIMHFFPNFNEAVITKMRERPGASLGIGFVTLIITPVVGFILFFTIIGIPFALLLLLSYPLSIYLVRIFAAHWFGSSLFGRKMSEKWAFALGLLLFFSVTVIPYIGWLANITAVLFGLGASIMTKKDIYYSARDKKII
jgi:cytoskeletal protein CcmA (bactofilin family)